MHPTVFAGGGGALAFLSQDGWVDAPSGESTLPGQRIDLVRDPDVEAHALTQNVTRVFQAGMSHGIERHRHAEMGEMIAHVLVEKVPIEACSALYDLYLAAYKIGLMVKVV